MKHNMKQKISSEQPHIVWKTVTAEAALGFYKTSWKTVKWAWFYIFYKNMGLPLRKEKKEGKK